MIKVLIVDDSPTVRQFLAHILGSDPAIMVVASASDGESSIEMVGQYRPDVVVMDIHMPGIDGYDATRRIMQTHPVPIVMVSGTRLDQVTASFRALEAGALAFCRRPPGSGDSEYEARAAELLQTVKLMSEVQVVRRWARPAKKLPEPVSRPKRELRSAQAPIKLVAIGASTGGPLAIQTILSLLPKGLGVPLLIVQHMTPGFVRGFAQWLGASSVLPLHVARERDDALPGHVYIAPEGRHMGIDATGRIVLSASGPEQGLRPSVSYLFRSVIDAYGAGAVGVLLTGMGSDGAEELKRMKQRGAITIAQDAASSVVHGMPGEAIKLDAARYILPPEQIAATLAGLLK